MSTQGVGGHAGLGGGGAECASKERLFSVWLGEDSESHQLQVLAEEGAAKGQPLMLHGIVSWLMLP